MIMNRQDGACITLRFIPRHLPGAAPRGPPKSKGKSMKTPSQQIVVSLRMTPEEKMEIQAQAQKAGLTFSEFLRRRGRGVTIASKADQQALAEMLRLGRLLKHSISVWGDDSELRQQALTTMREIQSIAAKVMGAK